MIIDVEKDKKVVHWINWHYDVDGRNGSVYWNVSHRGHNENRIYLVDASYVISIIVYCNGFWHYSICSCN